MYILVIKLVKKEGEQIHPKQFAAFFEDLKEIFKRDVFCKFHIPVAVSEKLDGCAIAFCLKTSMSPATVLSSLNDLIMVEEDGRATIVYNDWLFETEVVEL